MQRSKKILVIFAAAVGVLLVVRIISSISNRGGPTPPIYPQPSAVPTSYVLPTASNSVVPTIPQGDTITIRGIPVRNMYQDAVNTNDDGDVQFSADPTYHLVYLPELGQFLISIQKTPFAAIRTKAERALIESLGITNAQACQLNVKITTPAFANPDLAGTVYGLSFCP